MNLAEYSAADAVGLAELVRKKQVSPQELAKTALAAIDKVNPKLNAIADFYRERVDALDEKTLPEGPFRGVPFMLKPIGITEKGRPVSDLGSAMLRAVELPLAPHDCYVVQRFREVGLNILGRTHLPELAYTITVESPHQGVTHNPWNPEILAGGSSTGAAVLVAAGVLPMAHASDGAGSTRFPAAVNGVVGLKPSRGRISLGPDMSDITHLKISHFAVTRTVRDTAALLDAMQGSLPGESVMYRPAEGSFAKEVGAPAGKLRVALSNMQWHTCDLHPEVKEQLNNVGKRLEELGHIVTIDKPDIDFDAYRDMYRSVYYMDGAVSIHNVKRMMNGKVDTKKLQPLIQQIIAQIGEFSIYDYADAISATNLLSRKMGQFFEKYDVLVTPSLTEPVPRLGEYTLQGNMTPDAFLQKLLGCNQHLPMANLTGVPAISLPVCETKGGIPMGLHVFAPLGGDARLIRLAAQLEEAMPWRGRKPAVHVSNA
ncbi:MAG: amidase [Rhodospirillaceae bacterium]|nr:amidase [Rhodospirillaceae bacterium]